MAGCDSIPGMSSILSADDWRENIKKCTDLINSGEVTGDSKAQAYFTRGNSFMRLCDYRRAIKDYDEAARLASEQNVAFAYHRRGTAYANLGDFDQALRDWEKAMQLWGNVERVQRNLKEKGYYSGPIDGVIGRSTRRALILDHKARRKSSRSVVQDC